MFSEDIFGVVFSYLDYFSYTEKQKGELLNIFGFGKKFESIWAKTYKPEIVNYKNKKGDTILSIYYLNGELHRPNNLPAIENSKGSLKEWWYCGRLHRIDGPAMIHPGPIPSRVDFLGDDSIEMSFVNHEATNWEIWYVNGKLHRTDGPAVISRKNNIILDQFWYVNGKLHRTDGPAIEIDNKKCWYLNGKKHRTDGPAMEWDGDKTWYLNGELHRVDGPAVECSDGDKEWWVNGKQHRTDGPALEWSNEDGKSHRKYWYRDGKFHREDGPAVQVIRDGLLEREEWYRDGNFHREDGPAVQVIRDGLLEREEWYRDGNFHREDGPALKFCSLSTGRTVEKWYKNGRLHRTDGPAKTIKYYMNGKETLICEEWLLNGQHYCYNKPVEMIFEDSVNRQLQWFIDPIYDEEINSCEIVDG